MLIKVVKQKEVELPLTELQKMAADFLPVEQVRKFAEYQHLIEPELMNEARQPEMENVLKDLFNALHERNPKKLLKVLQGDKQKIFYAYKKQLESSDRLTEQDAKALMLISQREISLVSIVALK